MPSFKAIKLSQSREVACLVFAGGVLAGVAGFLYYYANGMTTAHYDAKAHLLVARRMVDSLTPGYSELGAHWLPLIHLVYLPFVIFDAQYRSGFLPSLISVLAFALSGVLAYKISFRVTGSITAGVFAAVVLLANPNLLYLQSCPLTEPVYMALLLLATHSLMVWREDGCTGLPWGAAVWTALGAMCRYEGWVFLGGVVFLLAADFGSRREQRPRILRGGALFLAVAGVPALAHFGYIFLRLGGSFFHRVAQGHPDPYLTHQRPFLSSLYHLAELSQVATLLPLLAAAAGVLFVALRRDAFGKRVPLLLLWLPSAINIAALYWGLVYRVRYSLLLLPAVAIFGSLATTSEPGKRWALASMLGVILGLPWFFWFAGGAGSGLAVLPGPGALVLPAAGLVLFCVARVKEWYSAPLMLLCILGMHLPLLARETRPMLAETMEHAFIEPERAQVLEYVRRHYDGTKILIDMGAEAPMVYDTGLAVREFVYNEGDTRPWHEAIRQPERMVGWMCMRRGDAVWTQVRKETNWSARYVPVVQTENYTLLRREK